MTPPRSLTQSYWEPERSELLLDVTLGGTLRQVTAEAPEHLALVDSGATPDQRHSWIYRQLLATAERAALLPEEP